jgi:hypothetical protein
MYRKSLFLFPAINRTDVATQVGSNVFPRVESVIASMVVRHEHKPWIELCVRETEGALPEPPGEKKCGNRPNVSKNQFVPVPASRRSLA